jgi:hypothetical protein
MLLSLYPSTGEVCEEDGTEISPSSSNPTSKTYP